MAQLPNPFNAREVDPTQMTGQLPVGKHPVVAVESEVVATKNNDGGMIVYTLQIIDGPQKGTTGAYRINLYNASQKAVEIAKRQYSALCHAVGVFDVQDSAQLHNIPFMVEVGLQKDSEQYTEIKKVFDINGNEPGKVGQQQQQQQQQTAGGWGQSQQQQQQQQQEPAGNGGWGQQQQQQQQQQQTSQAPWGQSQQQTNQAPWGKQ